VRSITKKPIAPDDPVRMIGKTYFCGPVDVVSIVGRRAHFTYGDGPVKVDCADIDLLKLWPYEVEDVAEVSPSDGDSGVALTHVGGQLAAGNEGIVPGLDQSQTKNLTTRMAMIREIAASLLLCLSGSIDEANSANFQRRVATAVKAGFLNLVFDVLNTSFASEEGIMACKACEKLLIEAGGRLVLLRMQDSTRESYEICGALKSFAVTESLDEAICALCRSHSNDRGTATDEDHGN